MAVDDDDEFFGNQFSESEDSFEDLVSASRCNRDETLIDESFGNISDHEYRSREASIRTSSYLDGYDETKEVKLQDGFSDGYRQAFTDAFRIGALLGSLCAKAARDESLTLGPQPEIKKGGPDNDSDIDLTNKAIGNSVKLVRLFLMEEILVGHKGEDRKGYHEALLMLENQLKKQMNLTKTEC
ncbi:hypothetical protein ACHAWF_004091 [Thalassiosira exigua]